MVVSCYFLVIGPGPRVEPCPGQPANPETETLNLHRLQQFTSGVNKSYLPCARNRKPGSHRAQGSLAPDGALARLAPGSVN